MTDQIYSKRDRYQLLHGQLRTERSSWDSYWSELAEYIQPWRQQFSITNTNRGMKVNAKIIDSTATTACRTLSSGMMSGITSPARPWFRLSTPDPDMAKFGPVKQWLDEVRNRMATVFAGSNVYNKLPTLYGDLGTFSTGVMGVFEDDRKIIRCQDFPVGSYYLANDESLNVRVFLREFRMTVRQLIDRYGDNVSKTVRSMADNKQWEQWVNCVQVISPNEDYDPNRIHAKYKRYSACTYEWGNVGNGTAYASADPGIASGFLEETGFDEFPILAARWEVRGEDVYGRNGPGMIALGDVKMLQTMEKKGLKAVDKQIDPPLFAPPEMRQNKVSLNPGDITYGTDATGKGFRPIHEVQFNIAQLSQKQGEARQRIERAFFADLFLMLTYADPQQGAQPVTATEINERREEKLLALGPVLEQLNQDVLDPLIDRTFAIMDRRGLLPEPPQELQGQPLKVEYISIMAQAQKLAGLSGMERFTGFVTNIAQGTQDPSHLDVVDFDELIEEYGDSTVPAKIIRGEDEVQQIRQQRQQAQQAAQQSEQLPAMANTAKTLSQTNTTAPSALTDLLGGGVGRPVAA